jgi:hypothetical protein
MSRYRKHRTVNVTVNHQSSIQKKNHSVFSVFPPVKDANLTVFIVIGLKFSSFWIGAPIKHHILRHVTRMRWRSLSDIVGWRIEIPSLSSVLVSSLMYRETGCAMKLVSHVSENYKCGVRFYMHMDLGNRILITMGKMAKNLFSLPKIPRGPNYGLL